MASNLPPGVNVNDLPGNQPIDHYCDKVFEILSDRQPDFTEALVENDELMKEAEEIIDKDFYSWKSNFSCAARIFRELKQRVRDEG